MTTHSKVLIPPDDINTQPNSKIVFNAPYNDKLTYHIKITNASGRRIGWATKTTNMRRLGVDLGCGVLDRKEFTLMAISCDVFDYGREGSTTTVSPSSGATPLMVQQSNSDANGSREMVWCARRTFPSSTILE
ncbi:MSP domain protein [Ancylostoma caninum]|uniref:Major sperm protein n=1 Tax=Ancylostoma caninum TaxID=29170 RepID=A0A368GT66_ANCCA|nr:MSP domain protein [Ancylostoma caninum]